MGPLALVGGEKLYYNILMKNYLLIILCLFVSGVSLLSGI